jgi:hypothetical protein
MTRKSLAQAGSLCALILLVIIVAVVVKAGYGTIFIIIPTVVLPIMAIIWIIKSRRDVKRGKSVDGFNICHHADEFIGTKTISYGAGYNKRIYKIYKCRKCGREVSR